MKAREFELSRLLQIKLTKSKLRNLEYSELKLQNYLLLENMNVSQALSIFRFRVRMVPVSDNFRNGNITLMCPLCNTHPDTQEGTFICPQIRNLINVRGEYNELFLSDCNYSRGLVETAHNINLYREEYRKRT